MESERHLAIVWVDFDLMKMLFHNTPANYWFRVSDGVPDGAHFINAWFDNEKLVYGFMFEHDSFPPVEYGQPVTATIVPLAHSLFLPSGGEMTDGL